jgi:adenine phosphoribosyltransferase
LVKYRVWITLSYAVSVVIYIFTFTGPPIAMALNKPFVMIRKKGKLPNSLTGSEYFKEYQGDGVSGGDELAIPKKYVQPGMRFLVIDDLVATGGTLIAACSLLAAAGAEVVECACVVELKVLDGYKKLAALHPNVKVWSLISEDILQLKGN